MTRCLSAVGQAKADSSVVNFIVLSNSRPFASFRVPSRQFASKLFRPDESALWLELLREDCGILPADTLPIEKEANELMAIMTTMINRTKAK